MNYDELPRLMPKRHVFRSRKSKRTGLLIVCFLLFITLFVGYYYFKHSTSLTEQALEIRTRGWIKQIIKQGKGPKPKVGDKLRLHYTGTLLDKSVFDDSRAPDRGPFETLIGVGNLIKGWDEAVLTMNVGERCILTIQPDFAYGAQGAMPKIPPNSVLVFDIELIAIING